MADRKTVILNYGPKGVEPDPPKVAAVVGTSLSFEKGANTPPDAAIRVTFQEPAFFSRAVFNQGEDDIYVTSDLPHSTVYDCDLMLSEKPIPRPEGSQGGSIEPGGSKGKGA